MFIPEKKEYMKEVDRINSESLRITLISLYNHLLGKNKIVNVNKVVLDTLTELFTNKYVKSPTIPLPFLDSNIGKVLFYIYFGISDFEYTIKDIVELTVTDARPNGYSKSSLNHDIEVKGILKGTFKNGMWHFTKNQVNSFLIEKGLSPIE